VENRFTKTKFDAAQSASVADGKMLSASWICKGRTWCATVTWKEGYSGVSSFTTLDEASLKASLLRLDKSVRFLGKVNPNVVPVETADQRSNEMLEAMRLDTATVSDAAYRSACQRLRVKPKSRTAPAETRAENVGRELSFSDAELLEKLRMDVTRTTDLAYRNFCAKLGVPPRPRPTQAQPTASTVQPANVVQQTAAWQAFATAHGELLVPPFGDGNMNLILQYLADEGNLPSTPATLEQAYRELKAANCFRTASTLTRGMNGDLQIVKPYSHERIVAMRNKQVVETANAAPDYLSDVEKDCWQAVRQAYPKLPVRSSGFQDCCKRTLVKWATDFALEADASLAAANKKGELSVAVTNVINQWSRIKKPAQSLSSRIWLG
jgi:hypothetical protein